MRVYGIVGWLPLAGVAACSSGGQASGAPARGERTVPVAVATVAPRDLARSVTVTGPVEPVRTIGVNSLSAGTVLALHVEEGDRVREGQVLAELDARETRAQLERARAVLANAEAVFERNKGLHASQIITDTEFEQSRSAFEVAKSDAEVWRTRVEFSRITAPSAGVVTAKHVEAGSAVSPNQRVFDLADVSLLVVRVQLSELDVVHVRPDVEVNVALDAYPDAVVRGRVRRVFPSADAQSRLVPVEVALSALPVGGRRAARVPGAGHFPNGSARGCARGACGSRRRRGGGQFVFVVQADSAVRRPVTLGITVEGFVEVTNGLASGERVVTSGLASLRPGTRVRVTESGE